MADNPIRKFERDEMITAPAFRQKLNDNFSECVFELTAGPGITLERLDDGTIVVSINEDCEDD